MHGVDSGGNDTDSDFDEFSGNERIDFSGLGTMNNITQILNATMQVGNNGVFNTGWGHSTELNGVLRADLERRDFIYLRTRN